MKIKLLAFATGAWLLVAGSLPIPTASAATGSCAPTADYGSVTQSVNVPATGTYTIWSRLATDSSSHSSYLLQVDTSNCFTVGNSSAKSIPVYAANATTHFANDSSNWLKTDTTGAAVQVANLTAGSHTLSLIGNAPGVMIDRIILTQDSTCTPTGDGDNCAIPPDTTPPTVNISAPADNATVSTTTNATANATDNVGVASVGFYVDNVLKSTDTTAPYSYSLDPSALGIGTHQITAKAYDAAGNNATSAVTHIVVPDTIKPTVTVTSPADNSTQSGTIVAAATAGDNVGIKKVEFYTDNGTTPVATATIATAGSYSASVSTAGLSNGSHTIVAKAYDAANNFATDSATFTVNNQTGGTDTTPPTIDISTLKTGTFLNKDSTKPYDSKSYKVSATAADATGVKQVVFKVDGVVKATVTSAPYAVTLDLSGLACGAHTLSATATDTAPGANSTTSNVTFNTTYAADVVSDTTCQVNYLDLSALASKFNQSGSTLGRSDINGDGVVNYLDLSALASRYGK